jgi:Holliday junction DNA helicase RuvA
MIGKLKGLVDSTGADWAIIDVGGVGYQVQCSARTLAALPGAGEAVSLAVETYVREDMIRLFGFAGEVERDWFRLLCTVQGVGTKVALALLSALSANELASAIALGDKAMIARTPGIGPKVAQRIVTELKDKGPAALSGDAALAHIGGPAASFVGPAADAVSALVNLGYGQAQAAAAIAGIARQQGDGAATAELIRLGLKELTR